MLEQCRGLPIGGFLSATLVELVALRLELLSWPEALMPCLTSRYRDIFFVASSEPFCEQQCKDIADDLTLALGMAVKVV